MTLNDLEIYIVGGYVRDRLLGLQGKDHDFVVVGATPQDMLDLGFQKVGAEFPVFLNPQTNDEFALARTERKSGTGYNGFEVDFDPTITLEQDLFRRDLTINAMARRVVGWNEHGHAKLADEIIDPFGGVAHLTGGVLKPVSHHFRDDPVRLLRAGRFAARYPTFAFTRELTAEAFDMLVNHELSHLVPERVFLELEKTMTEPKPSRLFDLLQNIKTPQGVTATAEIFNNCGLFVDANTATILETMQSIPDTHTRIRCRFAALVHRLTPEQCVVFLNSIKAPTDIRRICLNSIAVLADCNMNSSISSLNGERLMRVIEGLDCLRAGQHDIAIMTEVLRRVGNTVAVAIAQVLPTAVTTITGIGMSQLGLNPQLIPISGPDIAKQIRQMRVAALDRIVCQS